MKSVIVTTQQVKNYGAVLQAYGLHRFLEKNNYEHAFLKQSSSSRIYEKVTPIGKNTIVATIYNALIFFKRKEMKARIDAFDSFRLNYIPEVEKNKTESFDLYITGGDQLFNRSCLRTPVNFLRFGSEKAKRVSFCTSMGSAKFSRDEYSRIGEELERYSELSFREESAILALKNYVQRPMRTDIDCSFLIDQADWSAVAKPVRRKLPNKYLLVYELMHHDDIDKVINEVKEKTNLPVVAVLTKPRKSFHADVALYDVGPQEFIWLFQNAEYVVTTSFHGTCFSIINHKPFTVLVQEGEKRITSLLDGFALQNNYFSKYAGSVHTEMPDYSVAEEKIKKGRIAAELFFRKHYEV